MTHFPPTYRRLLANHSAPAPLRVSLAVELVKAGRIEDAKRVVKKRVS